MDSITKWIKKTKRTLHLERSSHFRDKSSRYIRIKFVGAGVLFERILFLAKAHFRNRLIKVEPMHPGAGQYPYSSSRRYDGVKVFIKL